MATRQAVMEALAYFSVTEHRQSFELLPRSGRVMLSAPHAVTQFRDGRVKYAERYTGMLCRLLHEESGCPVIYKTLDLHDDANYDEHSAYRDALCEYIRHASVAVVLDLHQMKKARPIAVCVGTGRGRNLLGREDLARDVTHAFEARGLSPVTQDDPFAALGEHTVSATVASRCRIPALQIEINTALVMADAESSRFDAVMDALRSLVDKWNGEDENACEKG